MKKLLIVDDERIERNGIKMLLNKMGKNLEILEAENGKKAYQILNETEIDLLLTDIKMPFISGIELVKLARELKPDIQIAIFSGFGEFTYAQEAIKYGVTDYILKPVKPQEFQQTIEKMLDNCMRLEAQQEQHKNNTSYLYKYLLRKYIFTGNEEYLKKILEMKTPYGNKKRDIAMIQNMMLLDTENNFFEEHGIELVELLKKNMDREIEYLDLNTDQMLLFFYKSATDNYARIAQSIFDTIYGCYGVRCYIAVSKNLKKPEEYPKAYQDLESQMENQFYCSNQWIFLYDTDSEQSASGDLTMDFQRKMRENIRLKDIRHLWENYQKFLGQIKKESIDSQMYVKFIFSEIVKDMYEAIGAVGSDEMINAVEAIYQAGNLNVVRKVVEDTIQEFEKECLETENGTRKDVEQVKQYINYHVNENLSIDKLAEKVYLSQGYLSYIFKKETGMNLSRYIKQARMEKAKELLQTTNMKIVQICEKVGFSSVSYFCQSFREYCGVSPEKYRKGETGDGELDE